MDRIYKSHFHLCYGGNDEDFVNFLVKYHGKEIVEDLELLYNAKGASVKLSDGFHYIWVSEGAKDADAILIHELLHFTFQVLRDSQISFNKKNEDVACYYMEYIYEEAMKEWKKLTKQNNGRIPKKISSTSRTQEKRT